LLNRDQRNPERKRERGREREREGGREGGREGAKRKKEKVTHPMITLISFGRPSAPDCGRYVTSSVIIISFTTSWCSTSFPRRIIRKLGGSLRYRIDT